MERIDLLIPFVCLRLVAARPLERVTGPSMAARVELASAGVSLLISAR